MMRNLKPLLLLLLLPLGLGVTSSQPVTAEKPKAHAMAQDSTLVSASPVASHNSKQTALPAPLLPHAEPAQPPMAWMGLGVGKPGRSAYAQLPALPVGIGFLVSKIEEGGPAERAGLQIYDIVWKLDDQLLVNESQLMALLRLKKPGETVKLQGFRSGRETEWELELAPAPSAEQTVVRNVLEDSIFRGDCGGPMRMVNLAEKVATYSNENGRAEVRKTDSGYQLSIFDTDSKLVFEKDIPEDGRIAGVPDEWKRSAYALRRGLSHALAGNLGNVRRPRPRVIVPPAPTAE